MVMLRLPVGIHPSLGWPNVRTQVKDNALLRKVGTTADKPNNVNKRNNNVNRRNSVRIPEPKKRKRTTKSVHAEEDRLNRSIFSQFSPLAAIDRGGGVLA